MFVARLGGRRPAPPPVPEAAGGSLMSADAFKERTAGSGTRPKVLKDIGGRLAEFHALPADDYVARRRALQTLSEAAMDAQDAVKEARRDGLQALLGEISDQLVALQMPALVQETVQLAQGYREIHDQLALARQLHDPFELFTQLTSAHEKVLTRIHEGSDDTALTILGTKVGDWLTKVVGNACQTVEHGSGAEQADAAAAVQRMIASDLDGLQEIADDPSAPQLTRTLIAELLAHRPAVAFSAGTPGTSLSGSADAPKYKMRHLLSQPQGRVERLGSLAHEMTHVDVGEAYGNTELLLICRRGMTAHQMVALAEERAAKITGLRGLLDDGVTATPGRRQLVDNKLDYVTRPGQLGKYIVGPGAGLDPDQKKILLDVVKRAEAKSTALVEYDTVLTQLLVYLHSWGVPQTHLFYQRVLELAAEQHAERSSSEPSDSTSPASG